MGLAFFEIEDQHAKLHVRGVERDKFTRVQKRYVLHPVNETRMPLS